jgi:hypothetical protein
MSKNYKLFLNHKSMGRTSRTINTLVFGIFSIIVLFAVTEMSYAESQSVTPLNDEIYLQKTITTMSVPADNVLPWGKVWGTVDDPVEDYPVIIQFFNEENGNIPVHVAQVPINSDDTYEYKFRVRNVDLETGDVTNIFEGDYTVKIFKVVNLPHEDLDSI